MYRDQVADLYRALSDPEARAAAAEILRGLIDRIAVQGDKDVVHIRFPLSRCAEDAK